MEEERKNLKVEEEEDECNCYILTSNQIRQYETKVREHSFVSFLIGVAWTAFGAAVVAPRFFFKSNHKV